MNIKAAIRIQILKTLEPWELDFTLKLSRWDSQVACRQTLCHLLNNPESDRVKTVKGLIPEAVVAEILSLQGQRRR